MERAGFSSEALAAEVGTTTKSVWRWRQGIVPRRLGLKAKIAAALKADEALLWPESEATFSEELNDVAGEILNAWAHRADAPSSSWRSLLEQAQSHIDLLAYAMQFLPEQNANLDALLSDKAGSGCSVRIALADPESRQVADRDAEELLGGTMSARIRTTLDHFKALFGVDGIEIRLHATPLYNSVFRGDDHMLVTPHLYRWKGYKAPLVHLRRQEQDGLFDNFMDHFERVWLDSYPCPAP